MAHLGGTPGVLELLKQAEMMLLAVSTGAGHHQAAFLKHGDTIKVISGSISAHKLTYTAL